MRHSFNILTALLATVALLGGCKREDAGFGSGNTNPAPSATTGYFTFAGGLTAEFDGELLDGTRAEGNTDVNTYQVEIVNAETQAVQHTAYYGTLAAAPVQVPLGKYYVRVQSGETADTAWEGDLGQPNYAARSEQFEIRAEHTETAPYRLDPITCTLTSVKVTVALEQAMAARCSDDVTLEAILYNAAQDDRHAVTYDQTEHPYGVAVLKADNRTVDHYTRQPQVSYLKPFDGMDVSSLYVRLAGVLDGVTVDQMIRISDEAKTAEWRKITLYIDEERSESGKIVINATIETWIYDEQIDIQTQSVVLGGLQEDQIPDIGNDPAAPRLTAEGLNPDDENTLTEASYDASGTYTGTAKIQIETPADITRFAVRIVTDNAQFASYLEGLGMLNTPIDLLGTAAGELNARNTLAGWGFPRASQLADARSLTVDLGGANKLMSFLHAYEGRHTVIVGVSAGADHYSRIELGLVRTSEGGSVTPPTPDEGNSIVWPGRDFEERHDVIGGVLEVRIQVTIPAGIRKFMVNLSGEIETGLDGMMPTEFDLVDPDSYQEDLSASLEELHFPTRGDVENKTSLLFDITEFMPMLALFPGESDFKLTVTDNNGETISRTIKLRIIED